MQDLLRVASAIVIGLLFAACDGDWCPPESRCGSRCVDLMSDPEHCGACYVRCVHPAECVEGVCEAPCPPTYHDGGDGECVPRGRCSEGYHDGGDGACVPVGECRPGYRDGGDGTCWPRGACAPGHHDGGDGSCVPEGTCADGFTLTPTGHCVAVSSCTEGALYSPDTLLFGRARPGETRLQLLAVEPARTGVVCLLRGLGFDSGSSAAFRFLEGVELPAGMSSDSPYVLLLAYEPSGLGSHFARVDLQLDGAPGESASLEMRGESSNHEVGPTEPYLRVEDLAVGASTTVWVCLDNDGGAPVQLGHCRGGAETSSRLHLDQLPPHGTVLEPGGRLCVRAEIERRRSGLFGAEVIFELQDGGLPIVVLILGGP